MALYVDANYTVDDADYFTDNPAGTYVFCDYWLTFPDAFAEGDELCPLTVTLTDDGPFMGRKKRRKGLASPPPLLVPALPNDDDEVLEQVLSLFMKGLQ